MEKEKRKETTFSSSPINTIEETLKITGLGSLGLAGAS